MAAYVNTLVLAFMHKHRLKRKRGGREEGRRDNIR